MKKIRHMLFITAVMVLTVVAQVASASACLWSHYQPEVPESLRK